MKHIAHLNILSIKLKYILKLQPVQPLMIYYVCIWDVCNYSLGKSINCRVTFIRNYIGSREDVINVIHGDGLGAVILMKIIIFI